MALAVGCGQARDLPPVVWEGQHLRYRTFESTAGICAGTFQHLDDRAGAIQQIFGSRAGPVDYSWTPGDTLSAYCDSDVGCAEPGSATSRWPIDEHELFHASRPSNAHRGFEEGLAVFYGDDRELPGAVGKDVDTILRAAGAHRLPPQTDYPTLAHFVSYLTAQYGHHALAELASASDLTDEYRDFASDVGAVLGRPLQAILSDFTGDYPVCTTQDFRDDTIECGQDGIDLPLDPGGAIDTVTRVDCHDPGTAGPTGPEIWTTLVLRVPETGAYRYSIVPDTSAFPVRVDFAECNTSCFDVADSVNQSFAGVRDATACLRQGSYRLRFALETHNSANFHVTFERLRSTGRCD
ncbi:MAG: hypothetical protein AAF721_03845 [Myxococcota bacterium]